MAANNSQLVIKAAILLLLVSLGSGYFGTGPYEIKNLQVLACEDQGKNLYDLSIQMYRTQNKTARVLAHRGNITGLPPDNYTVSASFFKKGTDWILVTDYEGELCKTQKLVTPYWEELCTAMGVNHSCLLPPGRHTFNNWIVHVEPMTPMLPYGTYKLIANVKNGQQELVACIYGFADVVQKFS